MLNSAEKAPSFATMYLMYNFSEYGLASFSQHLRKYTQTKAIIKYNHIEKSENIQEAKQNTHNILLQLAYKLDRQLLSG